MGSQNGFDHHRRLRATHFTSVSRMLVHWLGSLTWSFQASWAFCPFSDPELKVTSFLWVQTQRLKAYRDVWEPPKLGSKQEKKKETKKGKTSLASVAQGHPEETLAFFMIRWEPWLSTDDSPVERRGPRPIISVGTCDGAVHSRCGHGSKSKSVSPQ